MVLGETIAEAWDDLYYLERGACRKRSTGEIIFSEQGVTVPVHRLMTCLVEVGEAV